ncbi:hypothetical protein [uncultured Dialister sp.]|uniref:hypothetical protein n=1 Tax=uncultured Dialister sp. TaxID=278064 RepID=UPI0020641C9A|nr:hypothetical protein [uncultured Dialister sp.]DAH24417.1 MAG TPA: hypothetical protein [Caudoviricetes sp.]
MTTDIYRGNEKLRIITAFESGRGFTVPSTMIFRFWKPDAIDYYAEKKVYSANMTKALEYHRKLLKEYFAKGWRRVKAVDHDQQKKETL